MGLKSGQGKFVQSKDFGSTPGTCFITRLGFCSYSGTVRPMDWDAITIEKIVCYSSQEEGADTNCTVNCWGPRIFCPLKVLQAGLRMQINMRQINRKSNLIGYIWRIHTDMEIPKTGKRRYIDVTLNSGGGGRGLGLPKKGTQYIGR